MIQKERPRPNGNRDNKISRWQDKCFLSLLKNSMGPPIGSEEKTRSIMSVLQQLTLNLQCPSLLVPFFATWPQYSCNPQLRGQHSPQPQSCLCCPFLVLCSSIFSDLLSYTLLLTTRSSSFFMSSGHPLPIKQKHAHVSVWNCTLVDVGECSSMWTCMEARFWFRVSYLSFSTLSATVSP